MYPFYRAIYGEFLGLNYKFLAFFSWYLHFTLDIAKAKNVSGISGIQIYIKFPQHHVVSAYGFHLPTKRMVE